MGEGRRLTRIDFACNDPDSGNFAGRALRISYRDNELEPDDWFKGYAFTVDEEKCRLRIHRRWYAFERSKAWFGNWCWDAYWMRPREAKCLLRDLRASGKWMCTSGFGRFGDWFDNPTPTPAEGGASALS